MLKLNKKRGFTLVELIVVMAIIGILAVVAVPTVTHLINEGKISAEMQEVSPTRALATSFFIEKTIRGFDITDTDSYIEDFKKAVPVTDSVDYIEYKVVKNDDKFDVTLSAKGVEYDIEESGYQNIPVGSYKTKDLFSNGLPVVYSAFSSDESMTVTIKVICENGEVVAITCE